MMAKNKITRFGLIRHAETVWNREKKIQGQTDSPLTRQGISQALKWGRVLNQISWDRIMTSDIGRAIETAERINQILQVTIYSDPGLRMPLLHRYHQTEIGFTIQDILDLQYLKSLRMVGKKR